MNIILALLVFGIVVAIHELGHFAVAKLNGITVHEFAIGMGPAIFQKEYNGTKYSLRLVPMGGYVSMEGEDDESDDPNAFCKKTPLQRMAVVFAGPFMNFVLTIVVFIGLFSVSGVPVNKVGGVVENSPASDINLKIDDEIVSINEVKITSWGEITKTLGKTSGEVTIGVKRNGELSELKVMPDEKSGRRTIGIYPKYEKHFVNAIPYAFNQTASMTAQMLDFVSKLFTGKVDFNYVSGPVGIVREMGNSTSSGFSTFFSYIAFISLNLGVMNLLPIPALDGFRILTAFCEFVTKKKLNKKMEYVVNFAGMIFLIGLMIIVTYKDVLNIFKKG
ncbi:RIP metalloprotease RseP [Peptoanaerobacter stomatis]|uniref:Zinc metalloprotease n=1 Tax=Peptoanaerobacter stomatis TaxID=796937 RepID=V9HNB1_9FIRM|nr:RIP metalloprotease RseP [Peptoanaerobacter stomatis]EHL14881.1 RIP metalloprotease RseP [Peptoanaerobacter stomatis]